MAQLPTIVSVDDHVVEPPHVWETWLPEKYRDRGPKIERRKVGGMKHIGGGTARNVFHRGAAQLSTIAGNLDHLHAGRVSQLHLEHVARSAQRQTEHVETWPDIGNGGRCEHANPLISHGLADYRITDPP